MNETHTAATVLHLNLIQTLAVAALVYYGGIVLRRRISILDRLNIPSAVVGGLLFAVLVLAGRDRFFNLRFDTATQPLFNVAFFTTIGMMASIPLLKKGGMQVVLFLVISTVFCFLQNFIGMGIARTFDVSPLVGIIAGSVTLVGGPATGMAFAPLFEKAGVVGADTLALTAATFGIVCGGIIGGPVGTWLIKKHNFRGTRTVSAPRENPTAIADHEILSIHLDREDPTFVGNLLLLALAMGAGTVVSWYFESLGWTLPAYIGAMLVASLVRNLDDVTRWFRIDQQAMDFIGTVSLNIFLTVALMNLRLWELLNLAGPLAAILAVQAVAVTVFAATVSFWLMGRDYESAVMSGGFIGFVLGTTANAVANMKALVIKYGEAPRAFLVVPLVGAFFIDFTNAIIITAFLNWLT
ncbi:MAG TPA: sodium/glutamate symporter [Bacteroidota bacterium]|nr:sodium/glutamate symporter [Bacteroidota bacterium]